MRNYNFLLPKYSGASNCVKFYITTSLINPQPPASRINSQENAFYRLPYHEYRRKTIKRISGKGKEKKKTHMKLTYSTICQTRPCYTSSHFACMLCLIFHAANYIFKFRKSFKFTKQTTAHLTIRHFFQLRQIALLTICQTTKKMSKTRSA